MRFYHFVVLPRSMTPQENYQAYKKEMSKDAGKTLFWFFVFPWIALAAIVLFFIYPFTTGGIVLGLCARRR